MESHDAEFAEAGGYGPRVIRDDVTNERGELTFAESVRMTRGRVPGAERLCGPEQPQERKRSPGNENGDRATPDGDPWYDVPPGPPVLPDGPGAGDNGGCE